MSNSILDYVLYILLLSRESDLNDTVLKIAVQSNYTYEQETFCAKLLLREEIVTSIHKQSYVSDRPRVLQTYNYAFRRSHFT